MGCSQSVDQRPNNMKDMSATSVIIIGAGASGLAAACRLLESGITNVTILEASDRIGGRIHSVDYNYENPHTTEEEKTHFVELGAKYIYGQEGNVAYEMASSGGYLDEEEESKENDDTDKTKLLCDDPTVTIDASEMEPLLKEIHDQVEKVEAPETGSYGYFFNTIFENAIQNKDEDFKFKARIYKDLYHRGTQSTEGCNNWNNLSLVGAFIRYQTCPGKTTYSLRGRFSDLLDPTHSEIPINVLQLNSEVTKIIHDGQGHSIKVEVKGGKRLVADYVIFSCSLGVLKYRTKSLFQPSLPDKKLKAIEALEMGTTNKIILEFEETWWKGKDKFEGFSFLYSKSGFEDFEYTAEDAANDWTRFISGAYPEEKRPRLLLFWVSGEGAKVMETFSDQEISDGCMKTLRNFLQLEYINIPDPLSIKVTRWHSDPWTRGSYSYQTPESEFASITPLSLAEPVGNLLFCGEATHQTYSQTVHGAIESGWREADRIINSKMKTN